MTSSCAFLFRIALVWLYNSIFRSSSWFILSNVGAYANYSDVTWAAGCIISPAIRYSLKRSNQAEKTISSKLCISCLCEGNTPVTGRFPTQRASNTQKSMRDLRLLVDIYYSVYICTLYMSYSRLLTIVIFVHTVLSKDEHTLYHFFSGTNLILNQISHASVPFTSAPTLYLMKYQCNFVLTFFCGYVISPSWAHLIYLPGFFRVALQVMEQSHAIFICTL